MPIGLFILIDISRFTQGYLIQMDPHMVYNNKGCHVKSFSLVDELGRVKFLLSDKTGFLFLKFKEL
jgi:magnesium-transporting ATPase (P-type)